MNKVELLAPAGDLEKLKIALIYGADAVYIGGNRFSLRARASNAGLDELKEAVTFAHSLNKKVYVTCNIIPHNEDLEGLKEYLIALDEIKVDAIIASSPVIINSAHKYTNLEVHLSTQMSVTNSYAMELFKKMGVKRIVLARELSINEIKTVKEKTKMDIEVFIHGGMCAGYSGRCTLSNNMTDRDANRGGCAHSCRWNYSLYNNNHLVGDKYDFTMNSKDLCAIPYLKDLIDIGVDSLKIEGRMKSLYYIAVVVRAYRMFIDDYNNGTLKDPSFYKEEIMKAENRRTSIGFLNGDVTLNEQLYDGKNDQPSKEFVAIVKSYNKETKEAILEQRNFFTKDDKLEVMSYDLTNKELPISEIYNKDGEVIDAARHPLEIIKIYTDVLLKENDFIRKV